jgi:hypothetical protein
MEVIGGRQVMGLMPRITTPLSERKCNLKKQNFESLTNSGNRNLFEEKHTYSNEAHTKSQIIHSVDRPSKLPEEAVLQTQSDSQLMLTVQ